MKLYKNSWVLSYLRIHRPLLPPYTSVHDFFRRISYILNLFLVIFLILRKIFTISFFKKKILNNFFWFCPTSGFTDPRPLPPSTPVQGKCFFWRIRPFWKKLQWFFSILRKFFTTFFDFFFSTIFFFDRKSQNKEIFFQEFFSRKNHSFRVTGL